MITTTGLISSLTSGALPCVSGSGTSTIVNNPPLTSFDAGDSITFTATNCVDEDGDNLNGSLVFSGTTVGGLTAINGSISGVGFVDDMVDGSFQIIPSANFNLGAGTGSVDVSISQITGTNEGVTISLQKW